MALGDNLKNMRITILDLISDLKDNVFTEKNEKTDFAIVEFFFKNMSSRNIMNHVISNVLPHKEEITTRNEEFFKNNGLFSKLPTNKVHYYSNIIYQSDRLDKDDRNAIWAYFDMMIDIAESYKKNK